MAFRTHYKFDCLTTTKKNTQKPYCVSRYAEIHKKDSEFKQPEIRI